MIEARIIADSEFMGSRLTTFVLTYPRFILAELNTHRAFSRNSASSRAIPIWKMIKAVLANPARPVYWGANCSGMQSKKKLGRCKSFVANGLWTLGSWCACALAWLLFKVGVHKQLANRVIEPWAHMTTILTGTDFDNFFALRCHPDAQPEFQELAGKMLEAYLESPPRQVVAGEWHLPFAGAYGDDEFDLADRIKISVARCARVSYLNFEGHIDYRKDFKLHDDLLANGHMSPFEHVARADPTAAVWCGNLVGGRWSQYRKMLPNENRRLSREGLLLAKRKSYAAA